ncbi:MAG TPA: hypothetical protein DCL54_14260 [Alphaproteobacteria bacterium]|nr:hypothetical protein [Alphaproteobacteria bacterium]HAJ47734.1 hypothetical protein [Alphaproteobacteria bacterium]
MTYLIMQFLLCLIAAAIIGAIVGWLLRGFFGGDGGKAAKARVSELEGLLSAEAKATADARAQIKGLEGTLANTRTELEGKAASAENLLMLLKSQTERERGSLDMQMRERAGDTSRRQSIQLGQIASVEAAWRAKVARAEASALDYQIALEGAQKQIGEMHRALESAKADIAMTVRFADDGQQWQQKLRSAESQMSALQNDLAASRAARATLEAELAALKAQAMSSAPLASRLIEVPGLQPLMAAPVAAPPAPQVPMSEDDLKDIVGIGPVLERQLHAAGIKTFRDLAVLTSQGVLALAEKLEHVFGDRITRERWVEQAADLHRKKYQTEP